MDNVKEAVMNYGKYNCAQTIVATYAPIVGLDVDEAVEGAARLGRGMAKICGAALGMRIISEFISTGKVSVPMELSEKVSGETQTLMSKFIDRLGAQYCIDLKNNRTSCISCIRTAAELIEELLKEKGLVEFADVE